jgi:putative endonuclease
MPKTYFVYIMASETLILYIGMSNSLDRRSMQHKGKSAAGFASRYNVTRLVYYEEYGDVWDAIAREKELTKSEEAGAHPVGESPLR